MMQLNQISETKSPLGRIEKVIPTTTIHTLISAPELTQGSIASTTCSLTGLNMWKAINPIVTERLLEQFVSAQALDLDHNQLVNLTKGLRHQLLGFKPPQCYGELFNRVQIIYQQIAKKWAPLLSLFLFEVRQLCRTYGVERVLFLARDTLPLQAMNSRTENTAICSSIVDFNRKMIMSGASKKNREYLKSHMSRILLGQTRYAVVDTGLYGTLIQRLFDEGLLHDPLVIFLASKNPDIYGYLNKISQFSQISGIPNDFAALCCDTIECWPKPYSTARLKINRANETQAFGRISDPISLCASLTLCCTLASEHARMNPEALDPVVELAALYAAHKNSVFGTQVPVVLAKEVPAKSDAALFKDDIWSVGACAPLELW